ncbi:MAG TPA: thermopsin family protease, partial [Thermoplasmata archaeon]|nr:thermopsin family protease [Thermoplasmata archaeon]
MARAAYRGRSFAFFAVVLMGLSTTIAVVAVADQQRAAVGLDASPPAGVAPAAPTSPATAASVAYAATEAALQSHYAAVASALEASGVPARYIHLPSTEPAEEQAGAVVPGPQYAAQVMATGQGYTASPAPAGVAYYGESGADSGGSEATAVVYTTSLAGTMNVTNLSALYLDTDNPDQWGAQLNAVVTNVTLGGSLGTGKNGYEYWTQNVIGYQQFNQTLQFDENTWNFTTTAESFPTSGTSTIVAHDTNDTLYDGEVYVGESQYFYAPTPFNLTFYTNLSLYNPLVCSPTSTLASTSTCDDPASAIAAYAGDQTLFYNYSLTFPASNTHVPLGTHYRGNFDWLTFHTAKGNVEDNGANTRSAGLEASGKHADVIGLPNDWELDFGIGAYDGATQAVYAASGTASLDYVNDCSAYVKGTAESCTIPHAPTYLSVPAALNFGSETGETAIGIDVNFQSAHHLATFSGGPLNLHPLWGYASAPGVAAGQVAVHDAIGVSGSPLALTAQPYLFVFLEDTSVTAPAAGYAWAPYVPVWYLMPGSYNYEAMLADYTEQTGSFTVAASPVTVTATLPYATSNGVYTPLWAVAGQGTAADARIAGISSSGAGTLGSPYVLFNNNDTAASQAVNTVFQSHNDYNFPSFAGVLFWNTTAYVQDTHQIEFYTGSSTYGYLQQQFYEVQHVTLERTHNVLGWGELASLYVTTAAQNPLPQGNVMFWNSTNNLVMSNTFLGETRHGSSGTYVQGDELLFYGGGSECSAAYVRAPGATVTAPCGGTSGPAAGGSQNVVWGNIFCDTACTSTPSTPGTYAGLAQAESGDLIYNNEFKVDNPAPLMPWGLASELGPVFYHDTWNVPEQAASNVAETVDGIALSGNVLNGGGSTYALQGGNYWWNYGNSLNPYTTSDYTNVVDYTDGATSIFPPPYTANDEPGLLGTGDASPIGGFATTFSETGLPSGTTWWANVTLPGQLAPFAVQSSAASAVPLYLSDGSYAFSVASLNKGYADSSPPTPVVVDGSAQSVPLAFGQVSYSVTFTESGLPSGTQWWVNITSGPSLTTTGTSVATSEPSGSYTFSAASLDKAYSSAGGSFAVSGAPVGVPVTFTELVVTPGASPNPVEVSTATTISAGASGGSGSYTSYVWSGLPAACGAPGNVPSFGCTPTTTGVSPVQVTVTDSDGAVVTASFELTVTSGPTASPYAAPESVDEGQTTTVFADAAGGSGGYTYAWSGLPSGCGSPGDVASFACSPAVGSSAGSPYTVSVLVTDSEGVQGSGMFTLVVDPALTASPYATIDPVDEGQATTIAAAAGGGAGPYDYSWSGLPSGCGAPGDLASFVCTPAAGDAADSPYAVSVNVQDANGNVVTGGFALIVDAELIASPSATVNPVDEGQATTIAANAAGGSDYDYIWSGIPAGCGSP